jgi:subtilisin family serine protease
LVLLKYYENGAILNSLVFSVLFWSSSGLAMDVIAPAADEMILTTKAYYNDDYQSFSMTSAAAPHVTGLVNLLQSYLDDTMPAYKNLVPEECEHILEMTAVQNDTNVNAEGYSENTGWGIIDAGAAMRRVDSPYIFTIPNQF